MVFFIMVLTYVLTYMLHLTMQIHHKFKRECAVNCLILLVCDKETNICKSIRVRRLYITSRLIVRLP